MNQHDWQPISTAPKNDTPILVCNNDPAYGFQDVVVWGWRVPGGPVYTDNELTHWMPLPPYPPRS
jgi:hypothetical protein